MEKRANGKMEVKRSPVQGVINIVRFNWHFYLVALLVFALSLFALDYLSPTYQIWLRIILIAAVATTVISLLVSFYVYDLSALYKLTWLDEVLRKAPAKMVCINAGFDETSVLLQRKFPRAELFVFDFYDPAQHTEISIKRARKAYPPFPRTQPITTGRLPLSENSVDVAFAFLAAHEIRNNQERILLFAELRRVITPEGEIVVVEHLQDVANFLAYNIGFRHFLRPSVWQQTFAKAGLHLRCERKITPFISAFVLKKDGIAA
jgi:SAM-dependent methyltransferase